MKEKIKEILDELKKREPDKTTLQFLTGDLENMYKGDNARIKSDIADAVESAENDNIEDMKITIHYHMSHIMMLEY